MMYGVVVCSRCERARAVNLSHKTTTCECGSRIGIQKSKTYYKSDSQRDVAEAVRQMNARIPGAPPTSLTDEVDTSAIREGFSDALRESLQDSIKSRPQMRAILARLGVADSDKTIDRLLAEGVLYEPEKDHFRLV